MTAAPLLQAHALSLSTPGGRPLFRDLNLQLERAERVALIGRNGVGKSSLLGVLSGAQSPDAGELRCSGRRLLVPQQLPATASAHSPGQLRRRALQAALDEAPDLLLLDEPTHDLDRAGLEWLAQALARFRHALIVVSHDRQLLRTLPDFFLVAESGCRHFHGDSDALLRMLRREHDDGEERYLSQLARLSREQAHHQRAAQRRERRKNVGRIRELKRCTPRILRNARRSAAQNSRARDARIHEQRLDAARAWASAARRTLAVELPLEAALPALPAPTGAAISQLQAVSARAHGRVLFRDLSLALERQRLAVIGANGSGKSSLLELLAGERQPELGHARCDAARIGYIAQNSANWQLPQSLLTQLLAAGADLGAAAGCIRAHRFPFALAERPLISLSPGERLRAALICLLQRPIPPELLILDEPTSHLDFLGQDALQRLLACWKGGLVVATHDQSSLRAIGIEETLSLQGERL